MNHARFDDLARAELIHEIAYYSEKEKALGRQFGDAVREAVARALAFPLAGTPSFSEARSLVITGFPFRIVYVPEPDGIVILAIAHHSRRPGYWQSRAGDQTDD